MSNEGAGTVSVIDTSRGKVVGALTVGKRPRGIALSRDGSRLYVAVSGVARCPMRVARAACARLPRDLAADGVAVVDTRVLRVIGRIAAGSDPVQLALARGERQLFVADEDARALSVVDVAGRTILTHIGVGREPQMVRVSPSGDWVAVASHADNLVTLIDGHLLESVHTSAVGEGPRDLVFAPDGRAVYVADELDATVDRIGLSFSTPGEGGAVRAIPVGKLIQLRKADRPVGIVFDPLRRRLYVSTGSGGSVAVVALEGPKLVAEVPVGEGPRGIALTLDGRVLLTANGGSNDVSLVDTVTLRVIRRIPVGRSPYEVMIAP